MDPNPLPGILALPPRDLDHCALAWLGTRGYKFEAVGVSGRLVFVREGLNPWQATPEMDALAIIQAGQPAEPPAPAEPTQVEQGGE